MTQSDHHHHRAEALAPTLSILRLSALHRLIGAAALLAVLWTAIALVIRQS